MRKNGQEDRNIAQVPHLHVDCSPLSCISPATHQHAQFHVFLCKGFMVSLCSAVVTVFAVRGESVCRGHTGFQAQRQVADKNTCVGLRAVLGGTFARFVLDEAAAINTTGSNTSNS